MINDILQSRAWHRQQARKRILDQLGSIQDITLADCLQQALRNATNTEYWKSTHGGKRMKYHTVDTMDYTREADGSIVYWSMPKGNGLVNGGTSKQRLGYMTEPMSTDPIREGVIPSTVNAVYTELHNAYMRAYNETQ